MLDQSIVLIGMPGSGKSTVGKLLAKKTKSPFVDTDKLIIAASGKPLQRI
ncbi:MAG: shikimate kinase, partial [Saccharofermentanales bacterium]